MRVNPENHAIVSEAADYDRCVRWSGFSGIIHMKLFRMVPQMLHEYLPVYLILTLKSLLALFPFCNNRTFSVSFSTLI